MSVIVKCSGDPRGQNGEAQSERRIERGVLRSTPCALRFPGSLSYAGEILEKNSGTPFMPRLIRNRAPAPHPSFSLSFPPAVVT